MRATASVIVTPAALLPRGLEKLVASALREDDKMGCVGSNAAREFCLCTSGAMIRVSFPMVKQAARGGPKGVM
jgi:hypothetical protein